MEDTRVNKAEIRENYMKYARLFLKYECYYSYQEALTAAKVIKFTTEEKPKDDLNTPEYY